ncbi:TPA: YjzD family protein [Staphylococcus pseudintermedius]|nr:YjzD family protein [Staphylococcus pseudintermedius]
MKYFITLIWAILLVEMINFVLNSLSGGGPLNVVTPLFVAVIMVIGLALLDVATTPPKQSQETNEI